MSSRIAATTSASSRRISGGSGSATLNLGFRFDRFVGYVPAQDLPGEPDVQVQRQLPGRASAPHLPEQVDRPAQLRRVDRHPELEGHQPAARRVLRPVRHRPDRVKASLGRYVAKTNVDVAQMLNPINTSINSASRSWNDAFYGAGDPRSGNFVPDCNLGNFGANGECGGISNLNFGKTNPTAIVWSDPVREGLGRARQQLGHGDRDPARTAQGAVAERRLLPQHRRLLPQHDSQEPGHRQHPGRPARTSANTA